jgi:hypothetical protein
MTQLLVNPIVAMIHDIKNNRWHPILYVENPLPGPPDANKPVRHKSKMHHTTGFTDRAVALQNAKELADTVVKEGCWTSCKMAIAEGEDIPWDGTDVPADVAFFMDRGDGTMKRVL